MSGVTGAIWQLDIEKSVGVETWTNVYHLSTLSLADAISASGQIVGFERAVTMNDVTFTRYRLRDTAALTGPGHTYEIGLQGSVGGVPIAPLFVCVRIVMETGLNRPSSKYYRAMAGGDIYLNRFNWKTELVTGLNASICANLLGQTGLIDRHGNPFTSIKTQAKIAEHQLRRGSKRKAVPVLG